MKLIQTLLFLCTTLPLFYSCCPPQMSEAEKGKLAASYLKFHERPEIIQHTQGRESGIVHHVSVSPDGKFFMSAGKNPHIAITLLFFPY